MREMAHCKLSKVKEVETRSEILKIKEACKKICKKDIGQRLQSKMPNTISVSSFDEESQKFVGRFVVVVSNKLQLFGGGLVAGCSQNRRLESIKGATTKEVGGKSRHESSLAPRACPCRPVRDSQNYQKKIKSLKYVFFCKRRRAKEEIFAKELV